jgi:hypothetical protein
MPPRQRALSQPYRTAAFRHLLLEDVILNCRETEKDRARTAWGAAGQDNPHLRETLQRPAPRQVLHPAEAGLRMTSNSSSSLKDVILNGREAGKDLARIGRDSVDRLICVLPFCRQVMPMRIHALNQIDLFAATPAFDFFLADNCIARISEHFVIHQSCQVIATGEAGREFALVLKDSA